MRVLALLFVLTIAMVLSTPDSHYDLTAHAAAGMYEAPRPDSVVPAATASADDDEMICVNGVCAPRSYFKFAGSPASAGSCSGNQASASGCSGQQSYGTPFPVARAFGAGMYRITHPRTWFPRARARFGCGG